MFKAEVYPPAYKGFALTELLFKDNQVQALVALQGQQRMHHQATDECRNEYDRLDS